MRTSHNRSLTVAAQNEGFRAARFSKRSGSALLTVLWLTAALAAIGLAVANNVRGETERAATNVDDVKSYFMARGALERAALHILWGGDFYKARYPFMDLVFPSGNVHVELIPESSRLSLNGARPEDLLRLLLALGVTEDRANEIAAAILDWRTADPLHNSPFDAFYLTQSPSFQPRHASFLENEELLLVKGITPDLYYGSALDRAHAGLRDCVSVYGSGGSVDVNTAQPATLQAVGLSPADAAAIVRIREENPIIDYRQLAGLIDNPRLGIGGRTMFTLRATARIKDMRRTVAALVKFTFAGNTQGKQPGFEILRWFDRG